MNVVPNKLEYQRAPLPDPKPDRWIQFQGWLLITCSVICILMIGLCVFSALAGVNPTSARSSTFCAFAVRSITRNPEPTLDDYALFSAIAFALAIAFFVFAVRRFNAARFHDDIDI